tara:strand:- start:1040 stop:1450 length:411 start_codon:yes stop_codon:yes gene_type:complete
MDIESGSKLNAIDAHILGLKRKYFNDEYNKSKMIKDESIGKDDKKENSFLLSDILDQKPTDKKIEKYRSMEQRKTQKIVKHLSLYKNNILEQLKNCEWRLENSVEFSPEKERHQKEYDRLFRHKEFIFKGSFHPYL